MNILDIPKWNKYVQENAAKISGKIRAIKGLMEVEPLHDKKKKLISKLNDILETNTEVGLNKKMIQKYLLIHPEVIDLIQEILTVQEKLMGRPVDESDLPSNLNSYVFVVASVIADPYVNIDLTYGLSNMTDDELNREFRRLNGIYRTKNIGTSDVNAQKDQEVTIIERAQTVSNERNVQPQKNSLNEMRFNNSQKNYPEKKSTLNEMRFNNPLKNSPEKKNTLKEKLNMIKAAKRPVEKPDNHVNYDSPPYSSTSPRKKTKSEDEYNLYRNEYNSYDDDEYDPYDYNGGKRKSRRTRKGRKGRKGKTRKPKTARKSRKSRRKY
jgi:hypothetical protein